jgi:hypothetical protein
MASRAETLRAYAAAWSPGLDKSQRIEFLSTALVENGRYVDPDIETIGWAQYMIDYYAERPGHSLGPTSGVDFHHDVARFSWATVDGDGQVVQDGMDCVVFADDGKLQTINVFFGPLPASDD